MADEAPTGGTGGTGGSGGCDAGDDDDGDINGEACSGPAKALAAAQDVEFARVTLHRALRTVIRMLQVRGYLPVAVGNETRPPAADLLAANDNDGWEWARNATAVYASLPRAAEAELDSEILLEAVVPAKPREYSTLWADGTPPDTRIIVVIIPNGKIEVMRQLTATLQQAGVTRALLLSRKPLTAFSKRFLYTQDTEAGTQVEHFLLADLQPIIEQHSLVQTHIPLSAELAAVVRERYANGKFPRILLSDAMSRFMGFQAGQLVAVREVMGREQPIVTFFEVYDSVAS